jgi:hypothetical protein
MTEIYIVRAEDDGAPESIIYGVYPTEALAVKRAESLGDMHDNVWYDVVEVGPNGADCALYNR